MTHKATLVAAVLLLGTLPAAADWIVTADGQLIESRGPWKVAGRRVLYTDVLGHEQILDLDDVDLEGSKETTQLRTGKPYAAPEGDAGPAAAPGSLATAEPRVKIYVDAFCDACTPARELLTELGVPYTVKDVSQDKKAFKQYRKLAGHGGGMPVLDVDGHVVFRFNPRVVRDRVGELRVRQEEEARELLDAARKALGGGEAIAALKSLAVRAACTGPGGEFTTEVSSLRPDRVLFRQKSAKGISERYVVGGVGWSKDVTTGEVRPLSAAMRSMARGHEFHLLVFDLAGRFEEHLATGATEIDGRECREVLMRGADFGQDAAVCFDEATHLPAVLVLLPPPGLGGSEPLPAGPIRIFFDAWQEQDGLVYVDRFTLRHGEDVFTYDYESIRPNAVGEELFEVPAELREP